MSQFVSRGASVGPASNATTPGSSEDSLRHRWEGWIAFFLAGLALYALTANRGAQWQDPGLHILRIYTGELINPGGLALSHPLHYWLARAALWLPVGEPAFAITLVSALAGALAVANVFGCVMTITRDVGAASLAAASLMFAHVFWQLSTLAETYTLTACLLAGECWCVAAFARQGRSSALIAAFLLNGLGVANHLQAGLTTPMLAVVLCVSVAHRAISFRMGALVLLTWVVATLPYSMLVVRELVSTENVTRTIRSALFGHGFASAVLNVAPSAGLAAIGLAFLVYSFPNLLLPSALLGIAKARALGVPALTRRFLLAALAVHLVFVLRYPIVDQHTFLLPALVYLTVFGGIGFAYAMSAWSERPRKACFGACVLLLWTAPVFYAAAPALIARTGIMGSRVHNKPYRNDYVYLFTPWSVVEGSADKMSRKALALAQDDGVIVVEDLMGEFAVRYRVLREGRNTVEVLRPGAGVARIAEAAAKGRPVVLVPLDADKPCFDAAPRTWERDGDLYILR